VLENGVPKSLTGATIRCDFRFEKLTSPSGLRLTIGQGITVLNEALATFKIDKQIIDLKAGNQLLDIEVTYSDGVRITPFKATLPITQDVTHD
jgi:hypothetical protein